MYVTCMSRFIVFACFIDMYSYVCIHAKHSVGQLVQSTSLLIPPGMPHMPFSHIQMYIAHFFSFESQDVSQINHITCSRDINFGY